ncbi:serine hydrolase domain-containing protein [Aliikangiella coralliicola]|uniref:Serine hydrolase n=1 Tax=Aliikangiella coralliicola TaxID=2592383 RepID=A0A545U5W3_9GAMM|nr:serine hydrolase [Aliikangiella coralliicola]TQV84857.1 serine hydrolase [Aliikangiella coralliicola]
MKKGILLLVSILVITTSCFAAKKSWLEQANESIKSNAYSKIDSMLVYHKNSLIFESYYGRFNENTLHRTHSTFKSINGLLALIAFDQKILQANEFVLPLLKRFGEPKALDSRKKLLRVEHLLDMTSGLDCDEAPGGVGPSHEWGVDEGPTPFEYSLNIRMKNKPGASWHYCSANSFLLAAVISAALERANRENIFEFAHRYLFAPLEIEKNNYRLRTSHDGQFLMGQGNSNFKSKDLAKFGLVVLNKGIWRGKRIVSEASINELYQANEKINWSWTDEIPEHPASQTLYGNQWYQTTFEVKGEKVTSLHSWGNGGQFIFVVPKLEAVVVFTGSNQGNIKRQKQPFDIMYRYVLPDLMSR